MCCHFLVIGVVSVSLVVVSGMLVVVSGMLVVVSGSLVIAVGMQSDAGTGEFGCNG